MNLFPKLQRPYFVYAPGYTHISSGVRTLHLLVHALNEAGQKAYIVPQDGRGFATNPALNTPLCEPQHINFYAQNLGAIAVYPDVTRGNPLGLKNVVRYLLAPAGKYGGDATFPATDNVWGALPSIAKKTLRIPVSDPNIFYHPGVNIRDGSCFYAHKYDKIHGQKLLPITENSQRLEGSLDLLANILRGSEVCYLYELSSVITEAALCGCPIELIRTDYFNKIDAACMMGNVKWSDGEVVKECDDYLPEYKKIIGDFEVNLLEFIADTQGQAHD